MKKIFLITLALISLLSCKHELERPSWNTELLLPLVNSEINIKDILIDSTLNVHEDNNGFISLVYQQELTNINLDTILYVKDTLGVTKVVLDSLNFNDISITETTRLGEILGPIGRIAFPHQSTMNIPNMNGIIQDNNIPVDASDYFESMTFYKGFLAISMYNGLPTELANVTIQLADAVNNNQIASFSFSSIPPISHVYDSIPLAGQTINKDLIAILSNIDIMASNGPVIINHWDAIVLDLEIKDIGFTDATAIFPEQRVAEILKEHYIDIGSAEIEKIKIDKGSVRVNSTSTLPDTGRIDYNIPSLTRNGKSFTSANIIPPSNNGGFTSYDYNLDGYDIDLTGQNGRYGGDTINTIYTEFFAFVDSSGELVNINQNDSFYSYIDLNIIPEYAKGYLGQDTIDITVDEIETSIFRNVLSGELDLESAKLTFNITNYLGADLQIKFDQLNMFNSITSITESAGFDFLSQFHTIPRASQFGENNVLAPTFTDIKLDAAQMLSILPNKIESELKIYLNPFGPTTEIGFIYPEQTLNAGLHLEIPLSLMANNLTFIDTNIVEISQNNEVEIEKIFLTINNGIPFDANINVMLYDELDNLIDTLFNNQLLLSAKVDDNYLVTESTTSTLSANYNNSGKIRKIITVASFNTQPNNRFIKIYSDYKMDINMSAKLRKTIGN